MPRRTVSPLLSVFLVVVVAGFILLGAAYVLFSGMLSEIQTPQIPQPPPQPPSQPQAPPGRLQLQVQDIDTGAALGGTNARIDVVDPADLTKPKEIIIVDTTTRVATSALLYQPGQRLRLHIFSTEGNGYYPAEYEIVVPSAYTLSGNQYIYFLGAFGLKQRVAAAEAKFTLFLGASSLSSGTGSTAGSTGSASAPSKNFQLSLQINLERYRVAFGKPVDYINAKYERTVLKAVVWVAFNQTAVSSTAMTSAGWNPVSTTAITGWLVFYRVIDPVESSSTALGSATIPIPVDATSIPTGKRVLVYVWVADLQNPTDAAAGVGWTSFPIYGAYSGYGLTSALGFPFQSSGGTPISPHLSANISIP